jgi:antitoxin HicB
MVRYYAKLSRDDNGTVMVTYPDFPEAHTFGANESDALVRAVDALASAIQGRITDHRALPAPSKARRGYRPVRLPALIHAKLELYRAMLKAGMRKSELARRLNVHAPQIDRLLDLDHDSRLDQIEKAARALGRELHIEMKKAA